MARRAIVPSHAAQDPGGFADELVERLQANHQPVSLALVGTQGGHRVTVYGAEKVAGQWVFRLADPNYPQSDNLRFSYDSRSRQWVSQEGGRQVSALGAVEISSVPPSPTPSNTRSCCHSDCRGSPSGKSATRCTPIPSRGFDRKGVLLQNAPKVGGRFCSR